MAEPELFPNQPDIKQHVKQNIDPKKPDHTNTELTSFVSRLKILEERYTILRKKSQLTEQNIIETDKTVTQEIRIIQEDLLEIKKKIRDINEKMELLSEEIENFADSKDLSVLERYVDYWNLVEFATRKQVNDFLRKKFDN